MAPLPAAHYVMQCLRFRTVDVVDLLICIGGKPIDQSARPDARKEFRHAPGHCTNFGDADNSLLRGSIADETALEVMDKTGTP